MDLGDTIRTHIHGLWKIRTRNGENINWTDYISERAISTSITVLHSESADHLVEKSTVIVSGDFNAELGPGYGVERVSVGPHSQREQERKLDEAMSGDTKLHSTQHDEQKKTPEKQTT